VYRQPGVRTLIPITSTSLIGVQVHGTEYAASAFAAAERRSVL